MVPEPRLAVPHFVRTCPALLSLAMALLAIGCQGMTTYHTAQPIEKGTTELLVAPEVAGVFADGESDYSPLVEARLRYGVARDLDVGVGTSGFIDQDLYSFQADVNYVLWRPGGMVVSLDPTFASLAVFDAEAEMYWLPLLVDVWSNELATVTVAAKFGHLEVDGIPDSDLFNIDTSGNFLAFGVGAKLRIWKKVALVPELDVLLPLIDEFDESRYLVLGLGLAWD